MVKRNIKCKLLHEAEKDYRQLKPTVQRHYEDAHLSV